MKHFLFKILIFSLPVIFLIFVPVIFLKITGENYRNIDDLIINKEDYLIGYAYNEDNYKYLKYKELKNKKSISIIALGSSRILQFRNKMFAKSFYNAGYTISSLSDFLPFVINTNIKDKKPEVILITLDQWMFNENWDCLNNIDLKKSNNLPIFRKNPTIGTLKSVWLDLLKGKYNLDKLTLKDNNSIKKPRIGVNSYIYNTGFRKDGSFYYGSQINKITKNDSTANDFNFKDTFERIEYGNKRFEYGNQFNEKSIIILKDLLLFCKINDIKIVAIIPPFADKVNNKLKQTKNYRYMDSIFVKLKPLFDEKGFEIWDMTNLNKFNSSDSEVIDGFHAGEVSYLKMLIYMVNNGSVLEEYTNINELMNNLDYRVNNFEVY